MKKKNKKNRKKLWIPIIVMFIIIGLLVYLIVSLFNQNILVDTKYKIEKRSENVEKYKAEHTEYDTNGWLRVQGTNIDYPVIYEDEITNIDKIEGNFLWVLENPEELLNRTVILGHNIRNVSSNPLITDENHTKFEQLMSFIHYDFAKENQYIQYTKDGKDYLYQIFSVSLIRDYNLPYSGYLNETELKEYIEQALEDSYFKYDVEVDENDKIITLVTCTRFYTGTTSYRFKVEGKLLSEDEEAKLTEVTVKDNYKEIEDIMKGGEVNEKA